MTESLNTWRYFEQ